MKNKWILAAGVLCIVFLAVLLSVPSNTDEPEAAASAASSAGPEQLSPVQTPQASAAPEESLPPEDTLDLQSLPGYIDRTGENDSVCGLSLPYAIPNTPLVIEGIGQYAGPFIEDGSDAPVANVLALVVRNTGSTFAELAQIGFTLNGTEQALFQITGVPAGGYVLVMEYGRHAFSEDDTLLYADRVYAEKEAVSLSGDKLEIYAANGELTVKNSSDELFGTVYIRYKSKISPQCYLGGITYSCRFEQLAAGGEQTEKTKHFSQSSSEIVMVETID